MNQKKLCTRFPLSKAMNNTLKKNLAILMPSKIPRAGPKFSRREKKLK